ncbi:MAG TPA: 3-deoxy-7-phosphoheptulonate synthase [Chloroflexota bacterium]|nr:3-deoxy-7-phosphoheptulonate synthase [Chloroflexota bacterium]
MIIVMSTQASKQDVDEVLERMAAEGLKPHISEGEERTVIGAIGHIYPELVDVFSSYNGVDEVIRVSKPFKQASREFRPFDTIVDVDGVKVGSGQELAIMAGPCAVESEDQLLRTADIVAEQGARFLRGGAYKPRTSPYAFRGLGEEGLKLHAKARQRTGLKIITEVMTPSDVLLVADYADVLQIGARNMQNFNLLDEVGKIDKPVMLKRGMSATIEEWLMAAEYILNGGNRNVMLCERGIRTFEQYTRNTMDLSAIPMVKRLSHLPVIADPSHGTGKWYLIEPMAKAAVACGADGLIIEVHPSPDHALSDGPQSLTFENFDKLMDQVRRVAQAVGREVAPALALA